jgi:hypothetical protein
LPAPWDGSSLEYVCIFPDCDKPDTRYLSEGDWIEHLETRHTIGSQWVCIGRPHFPKRVSFDNIADFMVHGAAVHDEGGDCNVQDTNILARLTHCRFQIMWS